MSGVALVAPYSFKGGTYPGTGGTCVATLVGAATCSIVVTYNPVTVATHNQNVQVTYNDGAAAQTSTRAMTGVGVAAGLLSISNGATYNYGSNSRDFN